MTSGASYLRFGIFRSEMRFRIETVWLRRELLKDKLKIYLRSCLLYICRDTRNTWGTGKWNKGLKHVYETLSVSNEVIRGRRSNYDVTYGTWGKHKAIRRGTCGQSVAYVKATVRTRDTGSGCNIGFPTVALTICRTLTACSPPDHLMFTSCTIYDIIVTASTPDDLITYW